jgi:hypothetical protein
MFLGLESPFDTSFLGSDLDPTPPIGRGQRLERCPARPIVKVASCLFDQLHECRLQLIYWARSPGMKRCCDIRLPFKRKRQQSFATPSS